MEEIIVKTLTLQLGDKLYTTGRITAWQSREAFAINKDMLKFAQRAKEMDDIGESEMMEVMDTLEDVSTRRANLVCEVYGNKFTADELEKNLTTEEIVEQLNQITYGIMGVVQKN
nr:MAG TPA: hypothetical protein [Caudoviricetes sp.]